jgi:hypothetical protein
MAIYSFFSGSEKGLSQEADPQKTIQVPTAILIGYSECDARQAKVAV